MPLRHRLVITSIAVLAALTAAPPAQAAPPPPAGSDAVTAAAGTARTHEITIVMVDPSGVAPDYTRDDALRGFAIADAFYGNESAGAIRLHVVSATDWTTPDDPGVRCDDSESVDRFAQEESGFVPGPDKHLVAMTPSASCAPYSNAAQNAHVDDGGTAFLTTADPTTIAHELGHNMSLGHTSSVQCASSWDFVGTRLPSTCKRDEYGNHSDIMGGGFTLFPFSPGSLARLGLLRHEVVPACGASRRITIQTASSGIDAQRVIGWRDPAQPTVSYYVQYRDAVDDDEYATLYPSPFAEDDGAPAGVQVYRTDPAAAEAATVLSRPGDGSRGRQRIRAGERVPLADGMSVQVVSLDARAHAATVDVTVPCHGAEATRAASADRDEPADPSAADEVGPVTVVDPRR
jgi:hypothetical protein